MTRVYLPVVVIALAATACGLTPTVAPVTPPVSVDVPSTPTDIDISAPEGWAIYRNDSLGFGFAYPSSGRLAAGEGVTTATIDFAADPATNVVQEVDHGERPRGRRDVRKPAGRRLDRRRAVAGNRRC